jgi:cysteine synthase B
MYPTLETQIGHTPLVRLQHLAVAHNNILLLKLEGNNPAGSVKDRPVLSMISKAEERGDIRRGDTLIEATSGNTGIALAMVAAIRGYHMTLVMPDNMTAERRGAMAAYGANLILTPASGGMEWAIDTALDLQAHGKGKVLDQFSNPDNPLAHYQTTAPEIYRATGGTITHFVSAMGTTGTIMGHSRYFKEQNPAIQIIGVQPTEGSQIAGIRRWPAAYLPKIFDPTRVDCIMEVSQHEAETTTRALARQEGIFAGVSSGGALYAALQLAKTVENATIVTIACDRGDRYLSSPLWQNRLNHQ